MTLQNLANIGRLHPHEPNAEAIQRLLAAAERNLKDARFKENSPETRFDCAYKVIMQCALIALMAKGFRPATNEPGHHQTMIQTLPLTLGVSNETWIVLDGLRKKRNQSDYTGAPTAPTEVDEAIMQATTLLSGVRAKLKVERQDLLG